MRLEYALWATERKRRVRIYGLIELDIEVSRFEWFFHCSVHESFNFYVFTDLFSSLLLLLLLLFIGVIRRFLVMRSGKEPMVEFTRGWTWKMVISLLLNKYLWRTLLRRILILSWWTSFFLFIFSFFVSSCFSAFFPEFNSFDFLKLSLRLFLEFLSLLWFSYA